MNWFTFWKFLHIAFMFGAVAMFVGGGVVSSLLQRDGEVKTIRRVVAVDKRIESVAGPLMLAGIGFGIITAVVGGFSLTAPWLLISYGLLIAIFLIAGLHHAPHAKKLAAAAAEASGDDEPTSELLTLVRGTPRTRFINIVDSLLWVALVFAMVVKPFGA